MEKKYQLPVSGVREKATDEVFHFLKWFEKLIIFSNH